MTSNVQNQNPDNCYIARIRKAHELLVLFGSTDRAVAPSSPSERSGDRVLPSPQSSGPEYKKLISIGSNARFYN